MAAIQYFSKRLIVEGKAELQKLSDDGFMGVWRTLTELAKKPEKPDTFHIRFNVEKGAKAEDFQGFFGFFNKISEGVKVLWDKWTGQISKLIEKYKTTKKGVSKSRNAPIKNAQKSITEETLTQIKTNLSAQNRKILNDESYKFFKVLNKEMIENKKANSNALPDALMSIGLNRLKNNKHPLSDSQVALLLHSYDDLIRGGIGESVHPLRKKAGKELTEIFKKAGIQPTSIPLFRPLKDIKSQVNTISNKETNIKGLQDLVDNVDSHYFLNANGKVLKKADVHVRTFQSVEGVQLIPKQDQQLLSLYQASRSDDIKTIQGFANNFVKYMQKNPDDFLKEHLALVKNAKGKGGWDGDPLMIGLLKNSANEGRIINPNAKEIIQNLGKDPDAMEKFVKGLSLLLQDPMLLSKMPKALLATL